MKIYWGITGSRGYGRTIPHHEPVMVSAGGLWNGRGFRRKTMYWSDWALDCGGFIALNKWGDFPFTPDQYLKLIEERKPSWAASMDYPCEPSIAKGTKLTVDERIVATVEYAEYLCRKSDLVVPVLQGYELAEYEKCWQLLSNSVNVERLALGSVCQRQSTKEIIGLCWGLLQILPPIPIHGFGVKFRALRWPECWALFTSIDTDSWEYHARRKKLKDAEAWQQYDEMYKDIVAAPRQLLLT